MSDDYCIHLLIDSIDELTDKQEDILTELNKFEKEYGLKYYIASRNGDNLLSVAPERLASFSMRKFNLTQIKLFLDKFFSGDMGKSSTLLDALRDNQMLERGYRIEQSGICGYIIQGANPVDICTETARDTKTFPYEQGKVCGFLQELL